MIDSFLSTQQFISLIENEFLYTVISLPEEEWIMLVYFLKRLSLNDFRYIGYHVINRIDKFIMHRTLARSDVLFDTKTKKKQYIQYHIKDFYYHIRIKNELLNTRSNLKQEILKIKTVYHDPRRCARVYVGALRNVQKTIKFLKNEDNKEKNRNIKIL